MKLYWIKRQVLKFSSTSAFNLKKVRTFLLKTVLWRSMLIPVELALLVLAKVTFSIYEILALQAWMRSTLFLVNVSRCIPLLIPTGKQWFNLIQCRKDLRIVKFWLGCLLFVVIPVVLVLAVHMLVVTTDFRQVRWALLFRLHPLCFPRKFMETGFILHRGGLLFKNDGKHKV